MSDHRRPGKFYLWSNGRRFVVAGVDARSCCVWWFNKTVGRLGVFGDPDQRLRHINSCLRKFDQQIFVSQTGFSEHDAAISTREIFNDWVAIDRASRGYRGR